MYGARSYFQLGRIYPRTRLRDPYFQQRKTFFAALLPQGESFTVTDYGTGTDSVSYFAPVCVDTGTGIDTAQITVFATDSGTGTDSAQITVSMSTTDSGAGTDAGQITVFGLDSATGVDTVNPFVPVYVDSGTGTDTAQVSSTTLTATDSGTGVDSISYFAPVYADSGTGADTATITVFATDSGTGAETGQVVALLIGIDLGSGVDTVNPFVPIYFDSGTGIDLAVVSAINTARLPGGFGHGIISGPLTIIVEEQS